MKAITPKSQKPEKLRPLLEARDMYRRLGRFRARRQGDCRWIRLNWLRARRLVVSRRIVGFAQQSLGLLDSGT